MLNLKPLLEAVTYFSGRDMKLHWGSQQGDLRLQLNLELKKKGRSRRIIQVAT